MKDVERLEYIYNLMSKKQKADAERYPDFPEPPPVPKEPKAPKPPKVIKGEASNIPPPKEPKAPKAPKVLKGEVSNIPPPPKEPKAPKVLKGKANNQDIYGDGNVRVYQHNVEEFKTASPNLMKSLESLAKRGAQFYFEGKKVSTKEGLLIVKNEKNILIETHPYVNKKPEVRILTTPTNVSIPEPPAPPEPVSPLDHVIEMAKKNAKFYLEGKEITSDMAIEVMKKNKSINIDSRSNGKQPVVKMSTKPIKIGYNMNTSKSNMGLQKVELVAMISNEDLERQKIGRRVLFFSENFRNCSEYFFDGKSISENEALDIYARNEDIIITSEENGNKSLIIKC